MGRMYGSRSPLRLTPVASDGSGAAEYRRHSVFYGTQNSTTDLTSLNFFWGVT